MSDTAAIIYIVDDDPAMRDSIAFLVSSVGYTHLTCRTAEEFLEKWDRDRPGCLILDVRLPGTSGLELQRELHRFEPKIEIIFISGHGDIPMAVRAIRNGAIDFLEKPFDDQLLLDRINHALRRNMETLKINAQLADARRKLARLTGRERKIMALVIDGKTNKAIAQELDISVKTVENHRHNLMTKAGVSSVAQLVAWASDIKPD
jgi:two-component system, LuxR family, response regulator FixJ